MLGRDVGSAAQGWGVLHLPLRNLSPRSCPNGNFVLRVGGPAWGFQRFWGTSPQFAFRKLRTQAGAGQKVGGGLGMG